MLTWLKQFFTWWNGQTLNTRLHTWRHGELVGHDEFGNAYYRTRGGRLELDNSAGHSPLERSLRSQLDRALNEELRAPLPRRLSEAHGRGFADYFSTAKHAATSAAAHRRTRSDRGESPVGLVGSGAPAPDALTPSRPQRRR